MDYHIQEAIRKYNTRLAESHRQGAVFTPRCVLFDMDGVLYDSMPNHAIAWQRSMAEFGIRMEAADAYATEGMKGVDTIRILARRQLGKELTEAEAQAMYDEKTRLFHEMPTAPVFDGVIDIMQRIRKAGMQIGIVTGSGQRPLIKRLMDDFGEFIVEEHIVTAYNVEHGKPAPDPYLKGLQFAGNLKPWEGIVIENAPLGVRAGKAAGCFTIAINSGPLTDETLLREGADIVLPTMRSLCNLWQTLLKESLNE